MEHSDRDVCAEAPTSILALAIPSLFTNGPTGARVPSNGVLSGSNLELNHWVWLIAVDFVGRLVLLRNAQRLTWIDFVPVLQHGLVGFEDGAVATRVAIELLGDLRQGVA